MVESDRRDRAFKDRRNFDSHEAHSARVGAVQLAANNPGYEIGNGVNGETVYFCCALLTFFQLTTKCRSSFIFIARDISARDSRYQRVVPTR